MEKIDTKSLQPGDKFTVEYEVVEQKPDVVRVKRRGVEEESFRMKHNPPCYGTITHRAPRPIKVGDKVKWGTLGPSDGCVYEVLALHDEYVWLKETVNGPRITARLSNIRHVDAPAEEVWEFEVWEFEVGEEVALPAGNTFIVDKTLPGKVYMSKKRK